MNASFARTPVLKTEQQYLMDVDACVMKVTLETNVKQVRLCMKIKNYVKMFLNVTELVLELVIWYIR